MTTVDLNSDLGESFGTWRLGDDEAMLGLVSSANIACGFHAGDARTLLQACTWAVRSGVSIGAQVGYRDLAGFGRRHIEVAPDDLVADVLYQVAALDGLAKVAGDRVRYVKPHGALYHAVGHHEEQAAALVEAVAAYDARLVVLGLRGSAWLPRRRPRRRARAAHARRRSGVPRARRRDLRDRRPAGGAPQLGGGPRGSVPHRGARLGQHRPALRPRRALVAGDVLPVGPVPDRSRPPLDQAPLARPAADTLMLRAVLGPRDDWFTAEAVQALAGAWSVDPRSNRVGLRLQGRPLARRRHEELPSEGAVAGSVQIAANGLPVVFLADHPVTGGYPVIATVVREDLPLAAQAVPGQQLRLRTVAGPRLG